MLDITPQQNADYQKFWTRLETAVRSAIAFEDTVIDRRGGRPLGMLGYLNRKSAAHERGSPGLGDRVVKARRRVHRLQYDDYTFIKGEILEKFVGDGPDSLTRQMMKDLSASFSAYSVVEEALGAKKNPHRAPNFFNERDVNDKFSGFFAKNERPSWYVADHMAFRDFIDKNVDKPASSGRQGEAITNAWIICNFLRNNRHEFGILKDDKIFSGYMSLIARCGAWASQQVGQWNHFYYFKRIVEDGLSARESISAVAFNMLSYHEYNRKFFDGAEMVYRSDCARMAFRAYKEIPPGYMGNLHDEDATIFGNPATELVACGHGASFINDDADGMTIEGMLQSNADRIGPAYTLYEEVSDLVTLGSAFLNDGNIRKAFQYKENALHLLERSNELSNSRRAALVLAGSIEGVALGTWNNSSLRQARQIALNMGAFHRVNEIESLMLR